MLPLSRDRTLVSRSPSHPACLTESGEVMRGRIEATPAAVTRWVKRFAGREIEVAVEACTGWLFVCDALAGAGAAAHLAGAGGRGWGGASGRAGGDARVAGSQAARQDRSRGRARAA